MRGNLKYSSKQVDMPYLADTFTRVRFQPKNTTISTLVCCTVSYAIEGVFCWADLNLNSLVLALRFALQAPQFFRISMFARIKCNFIGYSKEEDGALPAARTMFPLWCKSRLNGMHFYLSFRFYPSSHESRDVSNHSSTSTER